MIESQAMLTIWRRHTAECPHRDKGRNYLKCNCPIWADGYVNGKRTLRQSLKTHDMARARKQAAALESPESHVFKPVAETVAAFLGHCKSEGLKDATICKYRNSLTKLSAFCEGEKLDSLEEVTAENLDKFRASRGIKQITAAKELEILRVFFRFCVDRKWTHDNPARKIKLPRNLKPNEVVPFTPAEITAILLACDRIGKKQYERLRARAMVLTLRYTALRIGDVSMLARDRISWDGSRWRIFLRTEKRAARVSPNSARSEIGAGFRASSDEQHRLPVLLLERQRQAEDAQGPRLTGACARSSRNPAYRERMHTASGIRSPRNC
jgi:integrase